jgi:hypothetical protein
MSNGTEEGLSKSNLSASGKTRLWILIIVALILSLAAVYYCFIYDKSDKNSGTNKATKTTLSSGPVTIPQKILDNKFGFLGGGADDTGDGIKERGALWVRPHPGAFVWDMMQKSANGKIDFTIADEEVSNYQKNNLGILATIWPFADWDQKNLVKAADCKVSSNDEFLPKNDKKGRGSYLPQYRCNPSDWTAYQKWVEAIVERYDGDGVNDMPGLKIPIKYWEVMNEPDLQYQSNLPADETDRLCFYKQGPSEYGKLLVETNNAIKAADPAAKVLIAGAAGADERMLGFYRKVFAVAEVKNSFDIGNIHCISNDNGTNDFNVGAYKKMLADFGITKPIWVTEAEAMNGKTADQNFENTKKGTAGAIAAGAERIFYTRYNFDDFRTDMSKINGPSNYPSSEKYQTIINENN